MAERLDVRYALIRKGWATKPGGRLAVHKGSVVYAPINQNRDSSVTHYGIQPAPTVEFEGGVPTRAIVAFCEALAGESTPENPSEVSPQR